MPDVLLTLSNAGEEVQIRAPRDTLLSAALQQAGQGVDAPCGGRGTCGKCVVRVQGNLSLPTPAEEKALGASRLRGGERLACQTRLTGDAQVILRRGEAQKILGAKARGRTDRAMYARYGAAVDIGTTTLVVQLYGPEGFLDSISRKNPQAAYGADVITRIGYAMQQDERILTQAVRDEIWDMLGSLTQGQNISSSDLDAIVLTGNTAMLYLLVGQDPTPLSAAPFDADRLFGEILSAQELFPQMRPEAVAYLPRCIAAFVGGDISTAILASGMCDRAETSLLVDLGTNGEIALWKEGSLLCCSTAAGPAFEGGGISQGSYAVAGAIDAVWLENGEVACSTIADRPAMGICGSGIVDAVAVLLSGGWVEETGAFSEDADDVLIQDEKSGQKAFPLCGAVRFIAQDVRNVQLAKGAVRAGIETLLQSAGVRADEVQRLYIAGGFGNYLDIRSALTIGLFPKVLGDRTVLVENAALAGAAMVLLDRDCQSQVEAIAGKARAIELSGSPVFFDNYMEYMLFEEE